MTTPPPDLPPPSSWFIQRPAEPEKDSLTDEEKQAAQEIFAGTAKDDQGKAILACYYCGGIHVRVAGLPEDWQVCCPRIKSMQRDSNGALLSVEFWPPTHWERDVIFPADVQ
jgi:hypothetical protein